MRKGVALLVAALAVAGCGRTAVKAYEGPSRPSSELAVLQGGAEGDEMSPLAVLEFASIDGVRRRDAYVISVLPGSHTFGVKQTLSFGVARRVQFCAFDMQTAPGCRYTPRPPSPPPEAIGGGKASWEWSVELPVGIECGGGSAFLLRANARCGSAERLLDERNPR